MELVTTILELLGAIPGVEYIIPGILVVLGANHVIKNYFSDGDDGDGLAARVRQGFDNIRGRIERARGNNRDATEQAGDARDTAREGERGNREARESAGNAADAVDDAKQSNREVRELSDRARDIIDGVRERNKKDE